MSSYHDHGVRQRLARIQQAWTAEGHPVVIFPHNIPVNFGVLGVNATSAPQRVTAPAYALAWIWIGMAIHTYPGEQIGGVPGTAKSGYLIRILEVSSGRAYGRHRRRVDEPKEWIPVMNCAGSGKVPLIFPYPAIVAPSKVHTFEAFNGTNVTQNTATDAVRLVLLGYNLLPMEKAA